MPSLGVDFARKRAWGTVKSGAMTVFQCGLVSFWWTSHRVSDEFSDNHRALTRAHDALVKFMKRANTGQESDK
jgi:hypothetical protein